MITDKRNYTLYMSLSDQKLVTNSFPYNTNIHSIEQLIKDLLNQVNFTRIVTESKINIYANTFIFIKCGGVNITIINNKNFISNKRNLNLLNTFINKIIQEKLC